MKKEQQMEEIEMIEEEPEEPGISFLDFLGVLFGRKILLLIVTASLFVASSVGILILNNAKSTYEGMYDYYVTGLADGKYIDGSRFDVRDLVTLEKLEQYKAEHEELQGLNMNNVYNNNVIKYLKYETIYKLNRAKLSEDDPDYLLSKAGYKIVLSKKDLSLKQAQVLTKAIADEANVISQQIVDHADYTQYLVLYRQSNNYDQQVEYLESQYNNIYEKYTNLITQYGDVVVKDSLKLSDIQLQMKEYFQNISFESLKQELDFNGYVKDFDEYETQIEKRIEALNRERNVAEQKKNALIAQRDALVSAAAAGQLQTLELTVYNETIIKLTNLIIDIDEEIAVLQVKLDNKGKEKTDPDYALSKQEFETKLANHCSKLAEMTEDYTKNEKTVVKKYSLVYFENNSIVVKENGLNLPMFLGIALGSSFVVAIIVNLCLDGKKLTRKYREQERAKEVQK